MRLKKYRGASDFIGDFDSSGSFGGNYFGFSNCSGGSKTTRRGKTPNSEYLSGLVMKTLGTDIQRGMDDAADDTPKCLCPWLV